MLLIGRQVLGELPAMFFLLAGYTFLLWATEKHFGFILGSIGFWSLSTCYQGAARTFLVHVRRDAACAIQLSEGLENHLSPRIRIVGFATLGGSLAETIALATGRAHGGVD